MQVRTLSGTFAVIATVMLSALLAQAAPAPTPREESGVPQGWNYPDTFEANAFVLESRQHGPRLCFGGIMDSLPPQCRGVPAVGWDWDRVRGEERRSGSTWGSYRVVGSYDGEKFRIEDAGKTQRRLYSGPSYGPFQSACSERLPTDPTRWTMEHLGEAAQYANGSRNVSAVWVDYLNDPPPNQEPEDPHEVVLNVAFTRRLAYHEENLREIWGGPLCVVRYERSLRHLRRIQRQLGDEVGRRLDLHVTGSSIDEVGNEVELGVVWIDQKRRDYLRESYGPGVVKTYAALHPVRTR